MSGAQAADGKLVKRAVIHAPQGIPGAATRTAPVPGDAGHATLIAAKTRSGGAALGFGVSCARRRASSSAAARRAPRALPAEMPLPWCANRRAPRRRARAPAPVSPEAAAMRAASIRARAPPGACTRAAASWVRGAGDVARRQRRLAELAAVVRRVGGMFALLLGRQLAPHIERRAPFALLLVHPGQPLQHRRRDSGSNPAGCAAFPRRDPCSPALM